VDIIRRFDDILNAGKWNVLCRGIRFRWLSEKDKGQAEAINKGFRMATGDIMGYLNSDDTYYPGTFEHVVRTIDPERGVHIAMGRCAYIDENGHPSGQEHPSAFESHARVVQIWKGYTIPQPAVFFHRSVYESCGGMDETLYFALDYDLFLRYSREFRFHPVDALWATYRLHSDSKTRELSQGELLGQSMVVSRRYWGLPSGMRYWGYLFSYLLHGGRAGIVSLKRLNQAEKCFHEKKIPAFAWNAFLSFLLFPPTIFRHILLPRLKHRKT
jgi:glycosyltransferase involved in cell wall biosynthesis